jgi:hypothetical protein
MAEASRVLQPHRDLVAQCVCRVHLADIGRPEQLHGAVNDHLAHARQLALELGFNGPLRIEYEAFERAH